MPLSRMEPAAGEDTHRSARIGGSVRRCPPKGIQVHPHRCHVRRWQIGPDLSSDLFPKPLGDDNREPGVPPLVALMRPVVFERVVKSERIARAAESLGERGQECGLTARMNVYMGNSISATMACKMSGAREQTEMSQSGLGRAAETEPVAKRPERTERADEQVQRRGHRRWEDVVSRGGRSVAELVRARGRGWFPRREEDWLDPATAELLALPPEEDVRLPGKLRHQISEAERRRHRRDSVTASRDSGEPVDTRGSNRLV